ncbi:Hyaluronan synthase 3 [Podila epigama]|nr:Hyaluronan synthase 3 [Podila epigama]
MPPQPPEETSVLSHHRPGQDVDLRLALHPKNPLAYTTFPTHLSGGLKCRNGNGVAGAGLHLPLKAGSLPSPVDYASIAAPTSPLPQENDGISGDDDDDKSVQYFDHSLSLQLQQRPNGRYRGPSNGHLLQHVDIYEPNNLTSAHNKNAEHDALGIYSTFHATVAADVVAHGHGHSEAIDTMPEIESMPTVTAGSQQKVSSSGHHTQQQQQQQQKQRLSHVPNGYLNGHLHGAAAVTTFTSGPLTVTTATSISSARNLHQRITPSGQPSHQQPQPQKLLQENGIQHMQPSPSNSLASLSDAQSLMEPMSESNADEHYGHVHPYYSNFYPSQQPSQHHPVQSFDPYPTPSPAPSYYSPFENFPSRFSTPILQPHQLYQQHQQPQPQPQLPPPPLPSSSLPHPGPTSTLKSYELQSPQSSLIELDQNYQAVLNGHGHAHAQKAALMPTTSTLPSMGHPFSASHPSYLASQIKGSTTQTFGLKSSHVSIWKKSTWILFTMSIFLLPYVILKACFHIQVSAGAWQTSLTYGMLMAIDFLAVISFSALNRRKVNQRVRKRDPHWVGLSTGILAVGYREDPVLLEGCLKSLRAIRYHRNQRVLLVVDGNEAQDEYMAQIFMKVFEKQGGAVFRPDFLCMDRPACDKAREDLVRQLAYHPGPVCVMQPHRGKRSAMYTGFAALLQQGIESVVVTDSDTYLDPNVCRELAFALAESPVVGAATGDVRIYNTGTWVSFLSSVRYWFAFNLERGAQSYHSVVNCVSGPLGIYRMSIVADVMDNWVKQSFLGVLCTYGDDRHLTNLVLREGYKVKFSHYAICYTDTPIRFIAWVTQQTRWSKSFFREIPIQLGCMHLHSPWMTYALLYQLIYPMMMIYNLVNCIYFGTGAQISWWLVSITLVGLMKTAYALWITRDPKFFFTTVYGFLYMLGYVPAKIFAALTLYDNSWGTR